MILILAVTFGCDVSQQSRDREASARAVEQAAALAERGKELFVRNGCQTCHGNQGRGDGSLAASLNPKPRDFRDRTAYKKGNGVEQIAATIGTGLPPAMPGYSHLTGQSRRQLAYFVASLQADAVGPIDAGGVRAESAWIRVSLPPHEMTAAYLELHNDGDEEDLLLGAELDIAETVEVHLSDLEGGMMRMREVDQLPVPAGGSLRFRPGGPHLMITGLKRPLAVGESVDLTLRFKRSGTIVAAAEVQGL